MTAVDGSSGTADEPGALGPTLVESDPDAGFNYPYFLYAPAPGEARTPSPVLVEPTSSPRPSDDFDDHRSLASRRVEGGTGRRIADELGVPFLTPVFPRPVTEPVDWRHYVHSLDVETLRIEGPPLERVDRQLLSMVADARERLSNHGLEVTAEFMLNGFSASGTFANRFAALHPEHLLSVTAGGINGMALLPRERARGHTLHYPVGVADLVELIGEPFDPDAFRDVNQFLYLGGDDDNDTIPYPDAWTDSSLARTALEVYGRDVHRDRFPYCQQVYQEAGAPAVFRIYEGVGHKPGPAEDDLVEFHRRSIEGDDIDEMRSDLGEDLTTRGRAGETGAGRLSPIWVKRFLVSTAVRVYLKTIYRVRH